MHYRRTQTTRRRRSPRRGFAIVLVLGLITMTLAVSYAIVRTQTATSKVSQNGNLRETARQAAYTGMTAGLRRMYQANWGGVDTTFTGTLGGSAGFSVAYATGDDALSPSAADATEWPYRVTMTVAGYATDPRDSSVVTTYKITSVAGLVPRQLAANPSPWSMLLQKTLYQTENQGVTIQTPMRVTGPVRLQGAVSLNASYPPSSSGGYARLLTDLNAMRTNGYPDYRPFDGPIVLANGTTGSTTRNFLSSNLGLSISNQSVGTVTNWSHPGSAGSYKLYAGGKSYNAATLPSSVANTTLTADPRTNPLGIYYRSGDVTVGSNVTVQGTIVTSGDVRFNGANISIQPTTLKSLDGATGAVQLPAIVAGDEVIVYDASSATVTGVVAAFGGFQAQAGSQSTAFTLQGNLICGDFDVAARSQWNLSSFWWSLLWTWFNDQLGNPTHTDYFPVYLQSFGLDGEPHLTISPQAGSVTKQWFQPNAPPYVPATGDAGLRWTLIRVKENP